MQNGHSSGDLRGTVVVGDNNTSKASRAAAAGRDATSEGSRARRAGAFWVAGSFTSRGSRPFGEACETFFEAITAVTADQCKNKNGQMQKKTAERLDNQQTKERRVRDKDNRKEEIYASEMGSSG
jgi:hypothetical protein